MSDVDQLLAMHLERNLDLFLVQLRGPVHVVIRVLVRVLVRLISRLGHLLVVLK